jgi:hypothetical protein
MAAANPYIASLAADLLGASLSVFDTRRSSRGVLGTSHSFLSVVARLDRDFVHIGENVFSISNRLGMSAKGR